MPARPILAMYFGEEEDGTKLNDAQILARAMAFRYQAYQRGLAVDEQAKKRALRVRGVYCF